MQWAQSERLAHAMHSKRDDILATNIFIPYTLYFYYIDMWMCVCFDPAFWRSAGRNCSIFLQRELSSRQQVVFPLQLAPSIKLLRQRSHTHTHTQQMQISRHSFFYYTHIYINFKCKWKIASSIFFHKNILLSICIR